MALLYHVGCTTTETAMMSSATTRDDQERFGGCDRSAAAVSITFCCCHHARTDEKAIIGRVYTCIQYQKSHDFQVYTESIK